MIAQYEVAYLRNVVRLGCGQPTFGYRDDGHGHDGKEIIRWQDEIMICSNCLVMIVIRVMII